MKELLSRGQFLFPVCCSVVLSSFAPTIADDRASPRGVIRPSLVRLQPGETRAFKVVTLATRLMAARLVENVEWSVNHIAGGNDEIGRIDGAGVYTAPGKVPTPHEVHIGAKTSDTANRYLFATVLLGKPQPAYKLLWSWSEVPERDGRLDKPHGIALDVDGNLLIADEHASRVIRYTPRGEYLSDLGGGEGSERGQFTNPREVKIDAEGRIFVTDSKGDRPRIQVFSRDGEFLRIFAAKGTRPGMILRAHGMAFDQTQRLFVVDVDNMRVNVYSHAGEFLYDWGKDGPDVGDFNAPHGLVVDPSGDVFVSGYYGPTQKFDAEGKFLFAFGHGDPPDGPVYFHSMAGDQWGNVYLAVRNKRGYGGAVQTDGGQPALSIVKYNNNGDYVTGWSLENREHRENAAAIDDDGKVYALFGGQEEVGVQVFEPQ